MQSTTSLPIADRVANALIAYVTYLGKLFVPVDMALPYPLTRASLAAAVVPFFVLAAITIAVLAARRSAPYLAVGWLWFLGTLVPVIGIVAIGNQSMADRYTYFSYVGLFIAIAFGVVDLARRMRIPDKTLAVIGVITVVIYAIVAMGQLRYWKDSETLFAHTLAVTRDNPVAEYNLGQTLQATKPDEAIPHLQRAIALTQPLLTLPGATKPDWYPQAYVGLGTAMLMKARPLPQSPARDALIRDAIANYRQALAIDPNAAHAKNNIDVAAQMMPRIPAAATTRLTPFTTSLKKTDGLSAGGQHQDEAGDIALRFRSSLFKPRPKLSLPGGERTKPTRKEEFRASNAKDGKMEKR